MQLDYGKPFRPVTRPATPHGSKAVARWRNQPHTGFVTKDGQRYRVDAHGTIRKMADAPKESR